MTAYRFRRKSQPNRNTNSKIRKSGKKNASREISHHLSGCRKALQQVRRNNIPVIIFSIMKKRMVNFRSEVMRKNP
jgi:sarcosine oxidase delta subunit